MVFYDCGISCDICPSCEICNLICKEFENLNFMERKTKMTELKRVLMNRDELTSEEADKQIQEMIDRVTEGENPEDILYDFELEPDYIFDII
jgi:hypothetical protein